MGAASDYEAPLRPSVTCRVNDPSPSPAQQTPEIHWVASLGTGGHHFPVIDTHTLRYARSVDTLERLKAQKTPDRTLLHHDSQAPVHKSLSAYEINGLRLVSGLLKVRPVQGERTRLHWLYSRNSQEWNIISHMNKLCFCVLRKFVFFISILCFC